MTERPRFFLSCLAALCLGGLQAACALPSPKPDIQAIASASDSWQAPLPEISRAADGTAQLQQWWDGWRDPSLSALQIQAARHSPSLELALARIAQARAEAAAAGAALWPALDLNASVTASRNPLLPPGGKQTVALASLDARWEIDLFGVAAGTRASLQSQLDSSQSEWHDARLSLAAEVANTYLALRSCEAQVALQQQIVDSQQLSLQMAQRKLQAGFIAPLELAQQRAQLALATTQLQQQASECAITVKALVVLSGVAESGLREQLASRHAQLPQVQGFSVATVPAATLLQRPDMRAAMQQLMARASEAGVAEARRLPALSLLGAISSLGLRSGGINRYADGWSFGPALTLPLFDAGLRRAQAEAAQARYEQALAQFRQKTLQSVKEVEEALLRLDSASQHLQQQASVTTAAAMALQAADASLRHGAAGVPEREAAQRQQLASLQQSLQAQRERDSAWIILYKAVGGDWRGQPSAESAP